MADNSSDICCISEFLIDSSETFLIELIRLEILERVIESSVTTLGV